MLVVLLILDSDTACNLKVFWSCLFFAYNAAIVVTAPTQTVARMLVGIPESSLDCDAAMKAKHRTVMPQMTWKREGIVVWERRVWRWK